MPVYTVHAPVANGADLAATDKFTFVRDGFHFWAAAASVIWLAWHRLWLALIGWIVLTIVVNIGLAKLGVGRGDHPGRRPVAGAADGIRSGEPASAGRCRGANGASSISSLPMTRKPPNGVSSIAGPQGSAASVNDQWSVDRGAPPPTRNIPGQPFSKPPPLPQGGIIGLFPEPGGSR